MTSERPAQNWAGDVGLGVQAWGGSRPTPHEDPEAVGPPADVEAVARKILLDALTGQARSRSELADRLAKKGVPSEVAVALLDRFTEVGLIDDAAFARQWVESRQRGKGLAPRALAQELHRKGVAPEVANAAIETIDEQTQHDAALGLVRKRMRSVQGLDHQKALRRLVSMLARKGYPPSMAYAIVNDELRAAGREPEDWGE